MTKTVIALAAAVILGTTFLPLTAAVSPANTPIEALEAKGPHRVALTLYAIDNPEVSDTFYNKIVYTSLDACMEGIIAPEHVLAVRRFYEKAQAESGLSLGIRLKCEPIARGSPA